jgi:hypothetical protein
VYDQVGQYYAAKKRDVKTLQKRLINKDQSENIRYAFKIGIYSQLSKGEISASMKHLKEAYDGIRLCIASSNVASKSSLDEVRDNSDIICL